MNQNEPMRDTQVSKEMQEMDEILGEIAKSITALDDRLAEVLMDRAEEKDQEASVSPPLVPLAHNLMRKNDTLRRHLVTLNQLRHRIEL